MVRTIGEDKSEQKVIDDIADFGWHCVNILAEDEHVAYSFTVGLFQSYGHPELIIFGLPSQVAHQILAIAADAAKSGTPLDLTQPTDALLNNYQCCFAEVPPTEYHEHVGYCRWYYQGTFRSTRLFGLLDLACSRGILRPHLSSGPPSLFSRRRRVTPDNSFKPKPLLGSTWFRR